MSGSGRVARTARTAHVRAPRAIVLLLGITSCPLQFAGIVESPRDLIDPAQLGARTAVRYPVRLALLSSQALGARPAPHGPEASPVGRRAKIAAAPGTGAPGAAGIRRRAGGPLTSRPRRSVP